MNAAATMAVPAGVDPDPERALARWMKAVAFLIAILVELTGLALAMWYFVSHPEGNILANGIPTLVIFGVSTTAAAFVAMLGGIITWNQFTTFYEKWENIFKSRTPPSEPGTSSPMDSGQ